MKLKCVDHSRRVVTTTYGLVHRCGDGSRCNSLYVTMGLWRYLFHPAKYSRAFLGVNDNDIFSYLTKVNDDR